MMLLPRVKKEVYGEAHPFGRRVRFAAEGTKGEIREAYARLLPELELTDGVGDAGEILLSLAPASFDVAEGYEIRIEAGCVRVRGADYPGLVHAAAVLSNLLTLDGEGYTLPDAEILDAPESEFRGLMLDPARHMVPMEEVHATILGMARARLNKLHLHLSDSVGFAFYSNAYPDLPLSPFGAYTRAELDEIISTCAIFGIDVIPELDVPAHAFATATWRPDLKCRVPDVEVSTWNLCLGNEETYRLIDTLLGEISEIFPYEYIHIGTDEMDMRDIPSDPRPVSHCVDCEVCRAFFSPMGLDTLCERFYYFVRRVHATVTALGKRVMMWNDDIDISSDPDIPHDILIEFWRVAAEDRGPVEGCSMQGFIDAGFDVINADFPNTYLDEYVKFDQLCAWDLKNDPATDKDHRIKGGETCLWEANNYPHFLYATYFALPLFGDRFLNCSAPLAVNGETTRALTRACLGPVCSEDFDLFVCTKGVPLGDGRFMDGKIFSEEADTDELRKVLQSHVFHRRDAAFLVSTLLELLGEKDS